MKNIDNKIFEKNTNDNIDIISYIYLFELFNDKITWIKAFEENDFSKRQLRIIKTISENYDKFKSVIANKLVDWTWERIAPLIRSILIFASFNIIVNNVNPAIDYFVEITKILVPDNKSYKFVNAILQKIGDEYEQIKNN